MKSAGRDCFIHALESLNWGATGPAPFDVAGDEIVNVNDLLAVITAWGAC